MLDPLISLLVLCGVVIWIAASVLAALTMGKLVHDADERDRASHAHSTPPMLVPSAAAPTHSVAA